MSALLIVKKYLQILIYLIFFISGWLINGWRLEARHANQLERARQVEQSLQAAMDAIANQSAKEMQHIADQRDAALDGLRNSSKRLPDIARADCAGTTGR